MRTAFSQEQLTNPATAECASVFRRCVQCGFCTATCPTYVLDGNELDSPRGRIVLMQAMLQKEGPPDPEAVTHIDRCLSCLSCRSHCPSGVDYSRLIDEAREHIEAHHVRPLPERLIRRGLGWLLSNRWAFKLALGLGRLGRPLAPVLPGRLRVMLDLLPQRIRPAQEPRTNIIPAKGPRRARVGLLLGCVQDALDPAITDSAIRVLTTLGADVVLPTGAGCCGALTHHMGRRAAAEAYAGQLVDAFGAEIDGDGLDYIAVTASGCGTMLKDYGHFFANDPERGPRGQDVAAKALDITEIVAHLGRGKLKAPENLVIAYQSACSLQHGQKIDGLPRALLAEAGFTVRVPAEGHLCCGSAGVYNLLQPDISGRLKARKAAALASTVPDVIVSGNIGCMTQLKSAVDVPLVHTVQVLDWALGGPRPEGLAGVRQERRT